MATATAQFANPGHSSHLQGVMSTGFLALCAAPPQPVSGFHLLSELELVGWRCKLSKGNFQGEERAGGMSRQRRLALCLGSAEQITISLRNSFCCKSQLLCGFSTALSSTWVGDTLQLVESYIAGKCRGKLEHYLPDTIIQTTYTANAEKAGACAAQHGTAAGSQPPPHR